MKKNFIILFIILSICRVELSAGVNVAVASNFGSAIKKLVKVYEEKSGNIITIVLGSTGKLYAQIKNGAPYDIFLAADTLRPKLLEDEKLVVQGSRFTYAIGQLVVYSKKMHLKDFSIKDIMNLNFNRIAIANPKLAPYGMAAKEVLINYNLYEKLKSNIVSGENINQTYQFVLSGNADIGFIALSHVVLNEDQTNYFIIPLKDYNLIKQQAVLLKSNEIARDFFNFLKSDEAKKIIKEYGYITP